MQGNLLPTEKMFHVLRLNGFLRGLYTFKSEIYQNFKPNEFLGFLECNII